ncbi:MAG: hypothetical protein RIR62_1342 [Pseudomonadota bacterium]|jgi:hypothetical protein
MSNPEPDDSLRRERRRPTGPVTGITPALPFASGPFLWWLGGSAADAP